MRNVQINSEMQGDKRLSSDVRFILDLSLSYAILYLLTRFKLGQFSDLYLTLGVIASLMMAMIYRGQGIYNSYRGVYATTWLQTKCWASVFLGLLFIVFFTKTSAELSREILLSWFVLSGAAQVATNLFFRFYVLRFQLGDGENTLIIGTGDCAHYLSEHLAKNPITQTNVVGIVTNDSSSENLTDFAGVPVVGNVDAIGSIIARYKVKNVYIALSSEEMTKLQQIYVECMTRNVNVFFAPPIFDLRLINHSYRSVGSVTVLALSETPLIGSQAFTKNIIDYTLASIALLLLSPLMIGVATAIKLSSPGPVIFKQKRHGWQGEIFYVYKFRSMQLHDDSTHVKQATKDDPRVTKIGRFIRKTSIDELPQLFNVLEGTMSLVGPRPHAVEHNDYYSQKIDSYMARHYIKPGITGLAQVNGCRGETKTVEEMTRRIDYDLDYINNWSNALDIKIMFKTVWTLFSDKAY
jgi:putative colanic acid biosynthesis UDP-glucose lipid carrier transferase